MAACLSDSSVLGPSHWAWQNIYC